MDIYKVFWKDPKFINILTKGTITLTKFHCRIKVKAVQDPIAAWVTENRILRKYYFIPAAILCKDCSKEPKYLIDANKESYCLCEKCYKQKIGD